ncbi:MAG: hypothetical protein MJZ65_06365 [Paludibacteraceae bacterium]|nr:hypothetical protein [Paludibacteraceae bacterium]
MKQHTWMWLTMVGLLLLSGNVYGAVWTETFDNATKGSGYSGFSYTNAGHEWTGKSAKVDDATGNLSTGGKCVALKTTSTASFAPSQVASLQSDILTDMTEVQFTIKNTGGSNVRVYMGTKKESTAWGKVSQAPVYVWDTHNKVFVKQDSWDSWNYVIENTEVRVKVVFEKGNRQIGWFAVETDGQNGKLVYIDDIEITSGSAEVAESETRSAEVEEMGIVCLPRAVAANAYQGVEFYQLSGREGSAAVPTNIFVEQVENLQAGMPYIYYATNSTMQWTYMGETVTTAFNYNGLYGNLEPITASSTLENMWVIYHNELMQVGADCQMGANKGYIKMDEVPEVDGTAAVSGRKMLTIAVPKGMATEIRKANKDCSINCKRLCGSSLRIVRNGQIYDIMGNQR